MTPSRSSRFKRPPPPPLRLTTAHLVFLWRQLTPEERLAFLAGVLTADERAMLRRVLSAPG
jgi:hypothetical protein